MNTQRTLSNTHNTQEHTIGKIGATPPGKQHTGTNNGRTAAIAHSHKEKHKTYNKNKNAHIATKQTTNQQKQTKQEHNYKTTQSQTAQHSQEKNTHNSTHSFLIEEHNNTTRSHTQK